MVARKWQLLDIKRRGRSKGLSPLSFALMRSDAKTCARALYAPRLASGECFHCPGGQAQDWSGPEVMGGAGFCWKPTAQPWHGQLSRRKTFSLGCFSCLEQNCDPSVPTNGNPGTQECFLPILFLFFLR